MIGRRLVWWRAKRQPDSLLLLYNKRLLLLIVLLNGLLQAAKGNWLFVSNLGNRILKF